MYTHPASRIAVQATCHRLCGRGKSRACLFLPIFCDFTPNVRVRRLPPVPCRGIDGNGRQGRAPPSRRRLSQARPASRICGLQRRAIIIPNRGKRFAKHGARLPPAPVIDR